MCREARDMPPEEDLAKKLDAKLAPYDPKKAEEALEALAEFLVSVWLRQRGLPPQSQGESALPGD